MNSDHDPRELEPDETCRPFLLETLSGSGTDRIYFRFQVPRGMRAVFRNIMLNEHTAPDTKRLTWQIIRGVKLAPGSVGKPLPEGLYTSGALVGVDERGFVPGDVTHNPGFHSFAMIAALPATNASASRPIHLVLDPDLYTFCKISTIGIPPSEIVSLFGWTFPSRPRG